MITKISHTGVFVLDQDRALDFYTNKLGFEVRTNASMGEFRWLTVGPKDQPEIEVILTPISEQMHGGKESAEQLRDLVKKGVMSGPVLVCKDIYATYEELKSKGVEFTKQPTKEFYKTEAVFKDDSGNWFSLGEEK
jgi:catechol 2,3-dioxygenase-like lactoylglutathione lyase family enzyme